tara:strand:- start:8286 stop:8600 length:315 start_codon:yes stop_codon:yes gene_type:complete
MSFKVDSNIVEMTHVNYQMSIFSAKTMRAITVASRFCVDSHVSLDSTGDSILNVFDSLWNSVCSWSEGYPEIERLDGLGEVLRVCHVYGHSEVGKAVVKCRSFL